MPFGTYMSSTEDAVRNAVRLVQEGRVEGIKMEGGLEIVETVRRLTAFGIPVMAHVGLKPQRHVACSGFRIQGKCVDGAQQILDEAKALEDAGAFSIVLEGIPKELGQCITERLKIPTIGIGAGPLTDGQVRWMVVYPDGSTDAWWMNQVLVWDDVMGTWSGHKEKFARAFGNVKSERDSAIQQYVEAVKDKSFPTEEESYTTDKVDWNAFRETNLRSHWYNTQKGNWKYCNHTK
jgi:3-methyl-2-oxobutanoate hydroxymethyltransferase